MTLTKEIIDLLREQGAWSENVKWAESDEASVETTPDEYRLWWFNNLRDITTTWWDGVKLVSLNGKIKFVDIDGLPHREHGPAVIHPDGSVEYWSHGLLDRKDGPAVIRANGDVEYRVGGKRHREGGPAIVWANGDEAYFVCDMLHRDEGPAIIYKAGLWVWYWNNTYISRKLGKRLYRANGEVIKYEKKYYARG